MQINVNHDKLATLAGALLAILHQAGLVGVLPQTKADWMNTGASVAMLTLGYLTNKQ